MIIKAVRRRKHFSDEQKLQILSDIDKGIITKKAASRKYSISLSGISYWRQTLVVERTGKFQREILAKETEATLRQRDLEEEIDRLKIQLAEAYLEMDFLKKAHSSIARERKLNTSVITAKNLAQFQEDAD